MIYTFIPYIPKEDGRQLSKTYNRYMELLPNDDDWACLLDHDVMFTTTDWYHQLGEIVETNKQYSCFVAVTSRIGNSIQRIKNPKREDHNIVIHREIGKRLQLEKCNEVTDITSILQSNSKYYNFSGFLMLVQKKAWQKTKFKEQNSILGNDSDFHDRLRASGEKIGLMTGVYLYHWYRYKAK